MSEEVDTGYDLLDAMLKARLQVLRELDVPRFRDQMKIQGILYQFTDYDALKVMHHARIQSAYIEEHYKTESKNWINKHLN